MRSGFGTISFFSGIGILDLGFERGGFRTWMANEVHGPYVDAHLYARDRMGADTPVRGVQVGPFEAFLVDGWRRHALLAAMGEAREETGLVGFVGGPPCPDFSVAGTR